MESHRGQLGDVVADLSFGVDAAGVIVGSKVVESCGGISKLAERPHSLKLTVPPAPGGRFRRLGRLRRQATHLVRLDPRDVAAFGGAVRAVAQTCHGPAAPRRAELVVAELLTLRQLVQPIEQLGHSNQRLMTALVNAIRPSSEVVSAAKYLSHS